MEQGIYSVDLQGAIDWAQYLYAEGDAVRAINILQDTFPGLPRDVAQGLADKTQLYVIIGNTLEITL